MITDAELTALYGNGLRPDTAARLIDDLRDARAQYAELERAEMVRDEASIATIENLNRRAEAAESRLAEVEAEIARWPDDWDTRFPCDGLCRDYAEEDCSRHGRTPAYLWAEIGKLVDRLAEVEAELDALREAAAVREHDYDELAALRADHLARCAGRLDRLKAAEARLAAVRALCDEADSWPEPNTGLLHTSQVRAVLAAVDGPPAEDRHEFVPKDVPTFSVFCSVCDSSKGHPIHRAAVDGPAEHRPDDERFECVTCGDCWPCSAAVDPPADHIAIFDGPPIPAPPAEGSDR